MVTQLNEVGFPIRLDHWSRKTAWRLASTSGPQIQLPPAPTRRTLIFHVALAPPFNRGIHAVRSGV
jgi:hypothetical protein